MPSKQLSVASNALLALLCPGQADPLFCHLSIYSLRPEQPLHKGNRDLWSFFSLLDAPVWRAETGTSGSSVNVCWRNVWWRRHPKPTTLDFFLIEVKFTWHEINHFKINASVAFHAFTMLCNHYLCLVPEHFHHPQRISVFINGHPPSLSHSRPQLPVCILSLWLCLF